MNGVVRAAQYWKNWSNLKTKGLNILVYVFYIKVAKSMDLLS